MHTCVVPGTARQAVQQQACWNMRILVNIVTADLRGVVKQGSRAEMIEP